MEKIRLRIFQIIEPAKGNDRFSRLFDRSILLLIILNMLAVILESFANHINSTIGDYLSVYGENGVQVFKIVGIVKSIEFMSYDFTQEGAIYITEKDIRKISNIPNLIFNN